MPLDARSVAAFAALTTLSIAQVAADSMSAQQTVRLEAGSRGAFDPSITEDPATNRLWMSYSSFDASTHSRWGVSLRIAYSDDGETWHDAGVVQKSTEALVGPLVATDAAEEAVEKGSRATWQNETSSLVYDRGALPEHRWKLFWHQSLWVGDAPRHAGYSWIALKSADSPERLAAAPAIKLFTGYMSKVSGESAGPPAFSPIPRSAAIELNRADPQLGACVFGQPAALSAADGLYLALDCAWLGSRPSLHTVLLRCAYPNCSIAKQASWTVIGRLTEPRDGPRFDERYKGFGGTALVEKNGRYYLLATPMTTQGNRYDGCKVFRFEDLSTGKLERKRRGNLIEAQSIEGIPGTHHGACAAHARLKSGILLSQIVSTAAPRVMQIRDSGVELR